MFHKPGYMALHQFLQRLFRYGTDHWLPQVRDLREPHELSRVIRRERSRADRTAGEFAVITFGPNKPHQDLRVLYPLIEHLQHRSRSIDDLGWSSDNKLWFILPNCSRVAADYLSRTLCRKFSSSEVSLIYTLYHYSADDREGGEPRRSEPGECHVRETHTTQEEPIQWQRAFPMESLYESRMPWWKRLLDVTVAAVALMALAPLLAAVALLIKLTSPGPVLFRQVRSGRGGRPFRMYKFRSMVADAESQKRRLLPLNEQDGPAFKMENDPRVTKVGRFLRAFSIDELPQLWNVLRGDMSLVGPRPLPVEETKGCQNWQRQRLDVTPGLTCFWQIKDRRSKIPFVEWTRLDIRYVASRSLRVDLRLIAQTILFIVRRKGV